MSESHHNHRPLRMENSNRRDNDYRGRFESPSPSFGGSGNRDGNWRSSVSNRNQAYNISPGPDQSYVVERAQPEKIANVNSKLTTDTMSQLKEIIHEDKNYNKESIERQKMLQEQHRGGDRGQENEGSGGGEVVASDEFPVVVVSCSCCHKPLTSCPTFCGQGHILCQKCVTLSLEKFGITCPTMKFYYCGSNLNAAVAGEQCNNKKDSKDDPPSDEKEVTVVTGSGRQRNSSGGNDRNQANPGRHNDNNYPNRQEKEKEFNGPPPRKDNRDGLDSWGPIPRRDGKDNCEGFEKAGGPPPASRRDNRNPFEKTENSGSAPRRDNRDPFENSGSAPRRDNRDPFENSGSAPRRDNRDPFENSGSAPRRDNRDPFENSGSAPRRDNRDPFEKTENSGPAAPPAPRRDFRENYENSGRQNRGGGYGYSSYNSFSSRSACNNDRRDSREEAAPLMDFGTVTTVEKAKETSAEERTAEKVKKVVEKVVAPKPTIQPTKKFFNRSTPNLSDSSEETAAAQLKQMIAEKEVDARIPSSAVKNVVAAPAPPMEQKKDAPPAKEKEELSPQPPVTPYVPKHAPKPVDPNPGFDTALKSIKDVDNLKKDPDALRNLEKILTEKLAYDRDMEKWRKDEENERNKFYKSLCGIKQL